MEDIGQKETRLSLEETVQRAMAGEADAFLDLMERMSDQMYKTAWSILKQDSDVADAVQETILTCYEKIATLREPGLYRTWAIRILLNECYQILRRKKPYVPAEEAQIGQIPAAADGMERLRFQELLSLADERYHLMLTLYYADGYSVKEIAADLSMNENTVKTWLARARDQIRRGLDEENRLSYGCR